MKPRPCHRRHQVRPGSAVPGEDNSIYRGNFAWPSSTLRLRRSSVKLLTVFGYRLEQCFVCVNDLFPIKCGYQSASREEASKSQFRRRSSLTSCQQNDGIETRRQHTEKQGKR